MLPTINQMSVAGTGFISRHDMGSYKVQNLGLGSKLPKGGLYRGYMTM